MATEYLILTKLQCHDNSPTNRRKHCSNEVNISHSGFVVVVVFKCLFILRETEHACTGEGQREKEKGKCHTGSELSARSPTEKSDTGLQLTNCEMMMT